jgi:hypothetical protein
MSLKEKYKFGYEKIETLFPISNDKSHGKFKYNLNYFKPDKSGFLKIGDECEQVSNIDFNVFFFDINNFYKSDISKQFFFDTKFIIWTNYNVSINRNGDLTYRSYLKIELPELQIDQTSSSLTDIIENPVVLSYRVKKLIVHDFNIFNIFNCVFPSKLEELYISNREICSIPKNLPADLKLLAIISETFNSSLTNNLPENLEFLYINSNKFNQPLTGLPTGLKVLSITSQSFGQPLTGLSTGLPTRLSTRLPDRLKILHIKTRQNIKIDFASDNPISGLPESLECVYLSIYGDSTNIKLLNELFNRFPDGLKVLGLELNYADKINLTNLPPGLETLSIKINSFHKTFDEKLNNLPLGLKNLFVESINGVSSSLDSLPESMESIYVDKYIGNYNKHDLPIGLKKIQILS